MDIRHFDDNETPRENIEEILKQFHISREQWEKLSKKLIDDGHQKKLDELKQLLEDLWALAKSMLENQKEKITAYDLINWAEILRNEDLDAALGLQLSNAAKLADKGMTWVYLGLNIAGLVLAALTNVNLGAANILNAPLAPQGSFWNYWDGLGGVVLAVRQIKQGEIGLGVTNLLSSAQLVGTTTTANVATYGSTALSSSVALCNGIMGFSFALCMFVSGGLEIREAQKCEHRIVKLKDELKRVDDQLEKKNNELVELENDNTKHSIAKETMRSPIESVITTLTRQRTVIQKAIIAEEAQRDNHYRAAKSWGFCGVAMTGVAVAAYFGLSAITLGAVPLATVVVGFIAAVSAYVRARVVSQVDYVANVRTSWQGGENSLYTRINKLLEKNPPIKGLDLNKKVKINKKEISLKEYLEGMARKDPEKLKKLLDALEAKDIFKFKSEISSHRRYTFLGSATTGLKIFELVYEPIGAKKEEKKDSGQDSKRDSSSYSPGKSHNSGA